MENYQEILDKIKTLQKIIDQKIIDQTKIPTIQELKKEWEYDGFEFNKILFYQLINTKRKIKINIFDDQKEPWCAIDGCLSLKQLIRLAKTLMSLGKKDISMPLKIENIDTKPSSIQRIIAQKEEKIFEQFKELGYKMDYKMEERRKKIEEECKWLVYNEKVIHLTRDFCQKYDQCVEKITYDKEIIIYTDLKKYRIVDRGNGINITIQEHQLLHKLFELWGWFDE